MLYALRGEKNEALQNLQKAIELGYDDIEWLKTDDSIDCLRQKKTFIKIVENLKKDKG